MSFLFKGRAKTASELAKLTKTSIQSIEGRGDEETLAKEKENLSLNLKMMKLMLYGDSENEPKADNIERLTQEILDLELIADMIKHMKLLDFEAKKDAASVINFLIRRGEQNNSVKHLQEHPEIFRALIDGCDEVETALNFGPILRECIRFEELVAIMLAQPNFYALFDYAQKSNFDLASDAFLTLTNVLTKQKKLVSAFLQENYDTFFEKYNILIQSKNYVTMRQSLKLLGEILLDRQNFNTMMKYINDAENLKILMILLRQPSKHVQFEAFHIFKVFVANPEKSKPVFDILVRNKAKLIDFLQNFQKDKEDEQFVEEKNILLATLARMD